MITTEDSDLSLASTEELIEELFRRKTFVGVLIYSPASQKFDDQIHNDLNLYTTLNRDCSVKILEYGIESLESNHES